MLLMLLKILLILLDVSKNEDILIFNVLDDLEELNFVYAYIKRIFAQLDLLSPILLPLLLLCNEKRRLLFLDLFVSL